MLTPMVRPAVPRPWIARLTVLVVLALVGCGDAGGLDPESVKPEIEVALAGYLDKLAQAHAARDPSLLDGLAVPKEQSALALQLETNGDRGEHVVPTLSQFSVTDLSTAGTLVYVTTLEIWDLERRTLGAETLLATYPGERFTVRYQLKRLDGTWLVYFRQSERIETS